MARARVKARMPVTNTARLITVIGIRSVHPRSMPMKLVLG